MAGDEDKEYTASGNLKLRRSKSCWDGSKPPGIASIRNWSRNLSKSAARHQVSRCQSSTPKYLTLCNIGFVFVVYDSSAFRFKKKMDFDARW